MDDTAIETKAAVNVDDLLQKVEDKYFKNGNFAAASFGNSIDVLLLRGSDQLPAWWSPARDKRLYQVLLESEHLAGLAYTAMLKLANINLSFQARDKNITYHVERAETFDHVVRAVSEGSEGMRTAIKRFILDYLVTDNGGFLEIMGEGPPDGPIVGAPWGLLHRDSLRCVRTGDITYPVAFFNPSDNRRYKLHQSRVIYMSQMPFALTKKNGVGLSSVSRTALLGEVLRGQITYKLEKMGRRPNTKLFVGDGIPAEKMIAAFMAAQELQDNLGLEYFGMNVYIGGTGVNVRAQDLNNFDPFDEQTGTLMAMYALAFAWGLKIQDIWPVSGSRASDEVSMLQARGRLPTDFTSDLKEHLDNKFCPPFMEAIFDVQDDDEDQRAAVIDDIRSRSIARLAEYGILDPAAQRRKIHEAGGLSRSEFVRQQLDNFMLEDGSPVSSLFYSSDTLIAALLTLSGVAHPLIFHENDPQAVLEACYVQKDACNQVIAERSEPRRRRALQALAALKWLAAEYNSLIAEKKPEPPAQPELPEQEEPEQEEVESYHDEGTGDDEEERDDEEEPDDSDETATENKTRWGWLRKVGPRP